MGVVEVGDGAIVIAFLLIASPRLVKAGGIFRIVAQRLVEVGNGAVAVAFGAIGEPRTLKAGVVGLDVDRQIEVAMRGRNRACRIARLPRSYRRPRFLGSSLIRLVEVGERAVESARLR